MPNTQPKDWREKFDEDFRMDVSFNRMYLSRVKDFISTLLSQKSSEIEEEINKLRNWEEPQAEASEQIDEAIKIIKQILR